MADFFLKPLIGVKFSKFKKYNSKEGHSLSDCRSVLVNQIKWEIISIAGSYIEVVFKTNMRLYIVTAWLSTYVRWILRAKSVLRQKQPPVVLCLSTEFTLKFHPPNLEEIEQKCTTRRVQGIALVNVQFFQFLTRSVRERAVMVVLIRHSCMVAPGIKFLVLIK